MQPVNRRTCSKGLFGLRPQPRFVLLIAPLLGFGSGAVGLGATNLWAQALSPLERAAALLPQQLDEHSPLEEAVLKAIEHDRGLKQAQSRASAAGAEARVIQGLGRPSFVLESRSSRSTGGVEFGDLLNPAYETLNALVGAPRFPTDLDLSLPLRQDASVRLTQVLVNPELRGTVAAARSRAESVSWQAGTEARRVATEAQRALLFASMARAERDILEGALARADEAVRVAERLLAEGLITDDARLRALSDRAELEGLRAAARARAERAALDYHHRTGGEHTDAVPQLGPTDLLLFPSFFPPDLVESELEARALGAREELRALNALQSAAEGGVRAAQGASLPSVAVQAEAGLQGQRFAPGLRDDRWIASIVVRWPLLAGGSNRARVEGARADVAQVHAARAEAEDQIRLSVRAALRDLEGAQAAVPAAEARHAAAAELNRLTLRRTEEGLATPLEASMARANLTAAELGRALSHHDVALKRVNLEAAAALRPIATATSPSNPQSQRTP